MVILVFILAMFCEELLESQKKPLFSSLLHSHHNITLLHCMLYGSLFCLVLCDVFYYSVFVVVVVSVTQKAVLSGATKAKWSPVTGQKNEE